VYEQSFRKKFPKTKIQVIPTLAWLLSQNIDSTTIKPSYYYQPANQIYDIGRSVKTSWSQTTFFSKRGEKETRCPVAETRLSDQGCRCCHWSLPSGDHRL
jgi:hypothetical protein